MSNSQVRERDVGGRAHKEIPPLGEQDAQLVNAAQRCLMAALDHSRAGKVKILAQGEDADVPVIELPPAALRVIARVLGLMGERRPLVLIPKEHELTTQEVANMLNVSRPFVIKQIEAGKLHCQMAGSHRRIAYEEMVRFRDEMKTRQAAALSALSNQAQDLDLGYTE